MQKRVKRKIYFPITSRVHYARQKPLLELLNKNPSVELQVVIGGSVLLDKYGQQFLPRMKQEGLPIQDILFNVIDGGNHVSMAKTAGLTALEFANSLHKLNPDIVLIRGDRFEQLAIAMTAAYMNKTIAHIEGGDVSGTIDESVRHAITKLAHIHFVTNKDAYRRVVQMGENPKYVFDVGSPDLEFVSLVKKKLDPAVINGVGIGSAIDFKKPYIMVMYHPVTTQKNNYEIVKTLLETIGSLDTQVIWFWPNSDAGTDEIAKAIRVYRELGDLQGNNIRFLTDTLPEDFIAFLRNASCFIGNSSAGIKEASYFGTPVVNIGTRQDGRLRGPHVSDVGYERGEIEKAIKRQMAHGAYTRSVLYYKANTSKKIMEVLTSIPLYTQKKFYDAKK